MKKMKDALRRFGIRIRMAARHFMAGRYGTDKLNIAILFGGVAFCLLSLLIRKLSLLFTVISYVLLLWAIFRCLSRNTYRRYQENSRYLALLRRLRDRDHRYFHCPRCRQPIRVPRGKGKIAITCPKCKEKFVKDT